MNNVEIGHRIKKRRKELGLTQTQIYEATGISSGNLSGIENGKALPSSAALINLSNILDCSIDYLLKGESLKSENIRISDIEDHIVLSPIEEAFIHNFRELTPEDQNETIDYINRKIRRLKQYTKELGKLSHSDPKDSSALA